MLTCLRAGCLCVSYICSLVGLRPAIPCFTVLYPSLSTPAPGESCCRRITPARVGRTDGGEQPESKTANLTLHKNLPRLLSLQEPHRISVDLPPPSKFLMGVCSVSSSFAPSETPPASYIPFAGYPRPSLPSFRPHPSLCSCPLKNASEHPSVPTPRAPPVPGFGFCQPSWKGGELARPASHRSRTGPRSYTRKSSTYHPYRPRTAGQIEQITQPSRVLVVCLSCPSY